MESKVRNIFNALWRQFPEGGAATANPCVTCKKELAVRAGFEKVCDKCLTKELSELVFTKSLANNYTKAIRHLRHLEEMIIKDAERKEVSK